MIRDGEAMDAVHQGNAAQIRVSAARCPVNWCRRLTWRAMSFFLAELAATNVQHISGPGFVGRLAALEHQLLNWHVCQVIAPSPCQAKIKSMN